MSVKAQENLAAIVGASKEIEVINVGDREADIYELLCLAQDHRARGVGLIVRSQHNREQTEDESRIWESLAAARCRFSERSLLRVSRPAGWPVESGSRLPQSKALRAVRRKKLVCRLTSLSFSPRRGFSPFPPLAPLPVALFPARSGGGSDRRRWNPRSATLR
jgi:hypothetical protein